jgi:hypothetical protein
MRRRNILMTSIVSTLLLTSTLSAQMHCKGGKCFVDLKKLLPEKDIESNKNTFKILQKHSSETLCQVHTITNDESNVETIVLDHTKYVMSENEKNLYIDDQLIENEEGTIGLDHTKYVMTDEERERFFEEERLREIELAKIDIVEPVIQLEERIIEDTTLPTSELFCEVPKKAEFHPESNSYECV